MTYKEPEDDQKYEGLDRSRSDGKCVKADREEDF